MVEKRDLDQLRSVEELTDYQKLVREDIKAIDAEYTGVPLPDSARSEFADLKEINDEISRRVTELNARKSLLETLADDPKRTERAFQSLEYQQRTDPIARKERDIYDLSRHNFNDDSPRSRSQFVDDAKRAIELAQFPQLESLRKVNPGLGDENRMRAHMERLLYTTVEGDPENGEPNPSATAKHFLKTGGPVYRRAFWKWAIAAANGNPSAAMLSQEESRALSLTGSGGGFAIPFALDPSIIPTSNSVVNPARALARLVTISGANTWQGVTSPAVSASRAAETTEASDNATTLVQPQVQVTKTQVFIPFSIEVSEDWPALEAEFGRLIQDSKDDEEGTSFVTGNGSAPNPQGFVTGATTTFAASTGLTVTAANMYGLEAALPPRFRPRESFVANRGIYNVVRAIDTAGGAALWLYMAQGLVTQAPTPGNTGATLLGRGAWEASAMQATVVNSTKIMVVGDFSYFLIVDRIGMTVELVPHIFGATSRFPIGQRGLYGYWRNSSKVLSASAFVAMTGTT